MLPFEKKHKANEFDPSVGINMAASTFAGSFWAHRMSFFFLVPAGQSWGTTTEDVAWSASIWGGVNVGLLGCKFYQDFSVFYLWFSQN